MEEFKVIYKILNTLYKSMDLDEFDIDIISHESLRLSEPKWSRLVSMLVDDGYIKGIECYNSFNKSYPNVRLVRPEITLKGLEYLEENSTMKKMAKIIKGISDTIH